MKCNAKHADGGSFDTAFHQTMPQKAFMYAIHIALTKVWSWRYSFHGTSHKYVSEGSQILKKPIESLKIITCHLGTDQCAAVDGEIH